MITVYLKLIEDWCLKLGTVSWENSKNQRPYAEAFIGGISHPTTSRAPPCSTFTIRRERQNKVAMVATDVSCLNVLLKGRVGFPYSQVQISSWIGYERGYGFAEPPKPLNVCNWTPFNEYLHPVRYFYRKFWGKFISLINCNVLFIIYIIMF